MRDSINQIDSGRETREGKREREREREKSDVLTTIHTLTEHEYRTFEQIDSFFCLLTSTDNKRLLKTSPTDILFFRRTRSRNQFDGVTRRNVCGESENLWFRLARFFRLCSHVSSLKDIFDTNRKEGGEKKRKCRKFWIDRSRNFFRDKIRTNRARP